MFTVDTRTKNLLNKEMDKANHDLKMFEYLDEKDLMHDFLELYDQSVEDLRSLRFKSSSKKIFKKLEKIARMKNQGVVATEMRAADGRILRGKEFERGILQAWMEAHTDERVK